MLIFCDTCSVLMVIRLAPEMFNDPRYMCVTTTDVRTEIVRKTDLKAKYPWRNEFVPKIKTLSMREVQNDNVMMYFETIRNIIEDNHVINTRTDKPFGLSTVDIKIAACVLANGYEITTAEYNLSDFLDQQFQKAVIEPLELVNIWLKEGLIDWDISRQRIIEDWNLLHEKPQSPKHIKDFERLSKSKYRGS